MREQGLHAHWPCSLWHHTWNQQHQHVKISSLTIDERVSGPLSPLPPLLPDCYFSCRRAETQLSPFANLPLCIIKHHMWSTVESRIAFWYFFIIFFFVAVALHKQAGPLWPTAVPQRRGEQWLQSLVPKLGCDLGAGREATAAALHSADTTCQDGAGAPQVSATLHQISWLTPQRRDSVDYKTKGASKAKMQTPSLSFIFPLFSLEILRIVVCLSFLHINSKWTV